MADDDMTYPLINKNEKDNNKKDSEKVTNENNNNINNNVRVISEDENDRKNDFLNMITNERIMRNKLNSKIYFTFFLQSLLIFSFIYYAFHEESFHILLQKNTKLFYVSAIIASAIMLVCFSEKGKALTIEPFNYFFFIIYSICIAIMICKIVILFSFETIKILWILIIFMLLSLTIYSFKSINEIKLIPTSFVVFIILSCVGVVLKIFVNISLINIIFIILCLMCLNLYIIYDVNSVIEEKKKKREKLDSFILNILVYFDIIMKVLSILNFNLKPFI